MFEKEALGQRDLPPLVDAEIRRWRETASLAVTQLVMVPARTPSKHGLPALTSPAAREESVRGQRGRDETRNMIRPSAWELF